MASLNVQKSVIFGVSALFSVFLVTSVVKMDVFSNKTTQEQQKCSCEHTINHTLIIQNYSTVIKETNVKTLVQEETTGTSSVLRGLGYMASLRYLSSLNPTVQFTMDDLKTLLDFKNKDIPHDNFIDVDYKGDAGVKFWMWRGDIIGWLHGAIGEQYVADTFKAVLKDGCKKNEIVLDIGANLGYYGLYAAYKGCQVLFFDPQPLCARRIQMSIIKNGFQNKAAVIPRPVSDSHDLVLNVTWETGCDGRYPMTQLETFHNFGEYKGSWGVEAVLPEELLPPDYSVKIMKIDTEGAELWVLRSIQELVKQGKIENIVVEMTPQFWPSRGVEKEVIAEVAKDILTNGNYAASVLTTATVLKTREDVAAQINTQGPQLDWWFYPKPAN